MVHGRGVRGEHAGGRQRRSGGGVDGSASPTSAWGKASGETLDPNYEKGEEEENSAFLVESGDAEDTTVEAELEEDFNGTPEEREEFERELREFFVGRNLEFNLPKFRGNDINWFKLFKSVNALGGYEEVVAKKLWKHIGLTFDPPKTCTTVSFQFRNFYEKGLLEYERLKNGVTTVSNNNNNDDVNPTPKGDVDPEGTTLPWGSKRVRAAAQRARQGWHAQAMEAAEPPPTPRPLPLRGKPSGILKRKDRPGERIINNDDMRNQLIKFPKAKLDLEVTDEGPQVEWVKINVYQTSDCFEVYALVPGLSISEVRIQCGDGTRLVIVGEPDEPDNCWGVVPFRKVVDLPSRFDAYHVAAVMTLHGQLFIKLPFPHTDNAQ